MTQEQYNRAVEIHNRIGELKSALKEICDTKLHRLWYAQRDYDHDWSLTAEWKMQYISEILDKHDMMIRQEIEDAIKKLEAEIETL